MISLIKSKNNSRSKSIDDQLEELRWEVNVVAVIAIIVAFLFGAGITAIIFSLL